MALANPVMGTRVPAPAYLAIETEPGEQGRQSHQRHRGGGGRIDFFKPKIGIPGNQQLAQGTDEAANQEGPQTILDKWDLGLISRTS